MNSNPLKYRSKSDLILPEYGRNIQRMVEIALTIEDKAERNRCARTIIDSMGNLFPYLRDVENYKHKLWDHLAVMSKFQLDIDYPYGVYIPEEMTKKPEKIEVNKKRIRKMHYGRLIQSYIEKICTNDDNSRKEECTMIIANHMKRSYMAWNKDVVDDEQIIEDLKQMSDGRLSLSEVNKLAGKQQNYHNKNKNNNNNNRKKRY